MTNIAEHQYPKLRFVIIPLFLLPAMMAMFMTYMVSPILPVLMEEFGTNNTTIGYAATIATGSMGICMFLAVPLIEKLKVRKTYLIIFVLYILSAVLCATAKNVGMFMVARLLMGAGWGLSGSAGASTVFMWYPPKERPAMFTANMLGTSFVTMFAFTLIVPLIGGLGWRNVYWVLAVINVIGFLLWLFVGRDYDANAAAGIVPEKKENKESPLEGYRIAFKCKELWILTIVMMFFVIGTSVLNFFYPTFLQQVRGMDAAASGMVVGVRSLASLIGSLVGGSVAVFLGRRKPLILAGTAGIVITFIMLFSFDNVTVLMAIMFLNGAMNFMNPAVQSACQDVPDMTAASSAAANAMMYGFGTFLGLFIPTILAALQGAMGLSGAMKVCAITVSVISFIAAVFVKERGPKAKNK